MKGYWKKSKKSYQKFTGKNDNFTNDRKKRNGGIK